MNAFNANTTKAMQALNFTHLSSDTTNDKAPYPLSGLPKGSVYHFPASQTTSDPIFNLMTTVLDTLEIQVSNEGFAVLSVNPSDFSIDNTNADYDALAALQQLVQTILASGYRVVPVGRINTDSGNGTLTGSIPSVTMDCNCVAFRMDDVQDSFCRPAQIAIMEVFRQYGIKLDIGIIGYYFANDPEIVEYVKGAIADPCWSVEVFNHGYYHEDFSQLNYSVAYQRMSGAQTLIQQMTGILPTVFVPPYNLFNLDTVQVAVDVGMTHFSSETDRDPPPYTYVDIWRFPMGAETANPYFLPYYEGVPHQVTFNEINNQLALYGWSVVMMHPQEFSMVDASGNYTTVVNASMIDELYALLDLVVANQNVFRTVHITEINEFFGVPMPAHPPATTGKTCVVPNPTFANPMTTNSIPPVDPVDFQGGAFSLVSSSWVLHLFNFFMFGCLFSL